MHSAGVSYAWNESISASSLYDLAFMFSALILRQGSFSPVIALKFSEHQRKGGDGKEGKIASVLLCSGIIVYLCHPIGFQLFQSVNFSSTTTEKNQSVSHWAVAAKCENAQFSNIKENCATSSLRPIF